nr:MAG: polyprotein [Wufeng shrew picorna-like virus 30]
MSKKRGNGRSKINLVQYNMNSKRSGIVGEPIKLLASKATYNPGSVNTYCPVCAVPLSGVIAYTDHLKSMSHRANYQLAMRSLPLILENHVCYCPTCKLRVSGLANFATHVAGTVHSNALQLYRQFADPDHADSMFMKQALPGKAVRCDCTQSSDGPCAMDSFQYGRELPSYGMSNIHCIDAIVKCRDWNAPIWWINSFTASLWNTRFANIRAAKIGPEEVTFLSDLVRASMDESWYRANRSDVTQEERLLNFLINSKGNLFPHGEMDDLVFQMSDVPAENDDWAEPGEPWYNEPVGVAIDTQTIDDEGIGALMDNQILEGKTLTEAGVGDTMSNSGPSGSDAGLPGGGLVADGDTVADVKIATGGEKNLTSNKTVPRAKRSERITLPDVESAKRALGRPQIYYSVTVDGSKSDDSVLLRTPLLGRDFMAQMPKWHKRWFNMFAYVRCTVNALIEYNGNTFNLGQLMAFYTPPCAAQTVNGLYDGDNYTLVYPAQLPATMASQRPEKLYLNLNKAVHSMLAYPWVYPTEYFTTSTWAQTGNDLATESDNIGWFWLIVQNALQTGQTARKSLQVKVSFYFTDVEFKGPLHFDSTTFLDTIDTQTLNLQGMVDDVKDVVTDILDAGQSLAVVGDELLGVFFDKPGLVTNPNANVFRMPTDWTHGNGRDPSVTFHNSPGVISMMSERLASSVRTMSWRQLCSIPMLLSTISIPVSSTADSMVFMAPITPYAKDSQTQVDLIQMSWLELFSSMASYWSGSLVFTVEAVKPGPMTLRLMVAQVLFGDQGKAPANLNELSAYKHARVNFDTNQVETFTTEWTSNKNVLSTGSLVTQIPRDTSCGQFQIWLMNDVSTPASTVQTAVLNIYVSAASNFNLHAFNNMHHMPMVNTQSSDKTASKDPAKPRRNKFIPKIPRKGVPVLTNGVDQHFGEQSDLSITCRKTYPLFDCAGQVTALTRPKMLATTMQYAKPGPTVTKRPDIFGNPQTIVTACYAYMYGSYRYKAAITSTGPAIARLVCTANDLANNNTVVCSLGTSQCSISNLSVLEWEVPWMSMYNFVPTFGYSLTRANITRNENVPAVDLYVSTAESSNVRVDLNSAFGDNFRLIEPWIPPLIKTKHLANFANNSAEVGSTAYRTRNITTVMKRPGFRREDAIRCIDGTQNDLVCQTLDTDTVVEPQMFPGVLGWFAQKTGVVTTVADLGKTVGENAAASALAAVRREVQSDVPSSSASPSDVLVDFGLEITNLCAHIGTCLMATTIPELGRRLVHMAIGTAIFRPIMKELKNQILKLFEYIGSVHTQDSFDDTGNILQKIISLVVAAVEWLGSCKLAQLGTFLSNTCSGIIKLGQFISACRSISTLFFWLVDCFKAVWAKVQEYFHRSSTDSVNVWLKDAEAIISKVGQVEYVPANEDYDTLSKVYDRGVVLREKGSKDPNIRMMHISLLRLCSRIKELHEKIGKALQATGYRRDPFCVSLAGNAGVGKSALVYQLCRDFSYVMDWPDENSTYSRNQADPFWSGYTGQPIVVIDDFMAIADADKAAEFIAAKSMVNYKLVMADLSEKGKSLLAKVIVCTTNVASVKPAGLEYYDALWRRRNMLVDVSRKNGGMVDWQNALEGNVYDDLVFKMCDPMDPSKVFSTHDYAGFLKLMRNNYQNYEKNQDRLLEKFATPSPVAKALGKIRTQTLDTPSSSGEPKSAVKRDDLGVFSMMRAPSPPLEIVDGCRCKWCVYGSVDFCVSPRVIDTYFTTNKEQMSWFKPEGGKLVDVKEVAFTMLHARKPCISEETMEPIEGAFFHTDLHTNILCLKEMYAATIDPDGSMTELTLWTSFWEHSLEEDVVNTLVGEVEQFEEEVVDLQKDISLLRRCIDKCKNASASIWKKIWSNIIAHPVAWICAAAVAAFAGVYLSMGSKLECETQSAYTDVVERRVRKDAQVTFQSGDPNAQALLNGPIKRNLVQMAFTNKLTEGRTYAQAVFIKDRFVMFNKHTAETIQEGCEMVFIRKCGATPEVAKMTEIFDPSRMWIYENGDLVIYLCGPNVQAGRDILCHFAKQEDLAEMGSSYLSMSCWAQSGELQHYETHLCTNCDTYDAPSKAGGPPIKIRSGFQYKALTKPGDSGGIVIGHNTRIPRKIWGIHVGASASKGWAFGQYVVQHVLEQGINALKDRLAVSDGINGDVPVTVVDEVQCCSEWFPQGNFDHLGVLKPRYSMNVMDKTDFHPSPICGILPVDSRPPMTEREGFEKLGFAPMRRQVEKYGTSLVPFHPEDMQVAIEDVTQIYLKAVTKNQCRKPQLWTLEEACFGNDALEYVDALNEASSPGFPYVLSRRRTGKKDFIRKEDNYINPMVVEKVNARLEAARRGDRVESYWIAQKKDQLVLTDKVNLGKCRAFVICNLDYSIAFRILFGDFLVAFYKSRIHDAPHAVGIDCESVEWAQVYYKLVGFSDEFTNGDFGKWDGTLMNECTYAFARCANLFYADCEANQLARLVMVEELCFCVQLWYNTEVNRWVVFQNMHGNPSGNPATVVINTFSNPIYHRCAWRELHRMQMLCDVDENERKIWEDLKYLPRPIDGTDQSMNSYRENVCEMYYGDDSCNAVKARAALFNQHNLSVVFGLHGLEYVSARKDGTDVETVHRKDINFLKRDFVPEEGYPLLVHPRISISTIRNLVNFYRGRKHVEQQACTMNVEDACRFMYHHGRKAYSAFVRTIAEEVDREYNATLPKYNDLQYAWRAKSGVVPFDMPSVAYLRAIRPCVQQEFLDADVIMYSSDPMENDSPCSVDASKIVHFFT